MRPPGKKPAEAGGTARFDGWGDRRQAHESAAPVTAPAGYPPVITVTTGQIAT